MKNIIICNSNNIINKISKNAIVYNNKQLYDLYDGRIINPPFFDNIYIERDDLSINDLQMIYNMTYTNGYIFFNKIYNNFFKGSIKIQKKDNLIYQFKHKIVDFIIMGTQKGGTTALSINIAKHPDIYINNDQDPAKSEIHFFDLNWSKGKEWYKKQFNNSYNSHKMIGEKTPELMYLDYTFPLIQSINTYVKIILILRNPIDRAYSAWKHALKYGETKNFEDAINDELNNKLDENKTFHTAIKHYLRRGLYYQQICNILKWFSRDNLLILINEEVIKDMTKEYNKVYSFLNLKEFKGNYKMEYISDDKRTITPNMYNSLINFYKKDVKLLEKFLNKKTGWLKKK